MQRRRITAINRAATARERRRAGWPMALAVGETNTVTEFVSPTSEEVGHPPHRKLNGIGSS